MPVLFALLFIVPAAGCPAGYGLGLVGWAVAAFGGLGLSAGRAAVPFGYLAIGSFVTRLLVLGFTEMFGL